MTAESRLTYGVIFTQIAFKPCEKAKYEICLRPCLVQVSLRCLVVCQTFSSLPLDQVAECARRCVAVEGLRSLQYGNSDGRIECRRTICKILAAQGVEADPDEMILTSGSQQALDFLGRVFLNSGDDIICEGPSYLGAFQAFSDIRAYCSHH